MKVFEEPIYIRLCRYGSPFVVAVDEAPYPWLDDVVRDGRELRRPRLLRHDSKQSQSLNTDKVKDACGCHVVVCVTQRRQARRRLLKPRSQATRRRNQASDLVQNVVLCQWLQLDGEGDRNLIVRL